MTGIGCCVATLPAALGLRAGWVSDPAAPLPSKTLRGRVGACLGGGRCAVVKRGSRGRHRGRVVVAVMAFAVAAAACSSGSGGSEGSVPPTVAAPRVGGGLEVSGAAEKVRVGTSDGIDISLGSVSVEGSKGSFDASGSITVAPVNATKVPGMVGAVQTTGRASGVVVDLGKATLAKPLTVRFAVPSSELDASGVAHVGDDGTWTPVPFTVDGSDLVATTDDFSSLVVFGIDVGAVFNAAGSFVAQQFAGRTDPPSCTGGPSWASVTAVPSGAVHSCVRSNTDKKSGAVRAELEVKSNRGTYQWVALPSDVKPDYVWVEGQPDWLRKAIGGVTGTDWTRTVLLDPGGRMTAGYRRPATGKQVTARVYPNQAAVAVSVVVELGKLFGLDGPLAPLTAAWCLDVVDVDLAAPVTTWGKLPSSPAPLLDCFVDKIALLWRDPRKAVAAAVDSVAPGAPTAELEASAAKFHSLGKAAVVIQLSGIAARVLSQTLDAALDAFGFDNVGDATLTLTAAPRGLTLGTDSIGDIPFGTEGAEARRRLVAVLGETSEPDSVVTMTECRPVPSTILRWGDFWVGLVGPPGDQTLSGYSLFGDGDSRLSTAEGVTVGDRYEEFVDGFGDAKPSVSVTDDSTYVLDAPGPEIEMGGQEYGDRALSISAGVVPECSE